ncbi:ABC transporter permease [Gayadomonas joobiniege]|uniref:ABC transporter permease n=1 Tax=Gayadomonas joobiniege TaxID=1234606 RepID=UPI000380647B|nr:ABC transporter permease [Gayadomonas joobiniege]
MNKILYHRAWQLAFLPIAIGSFTFFLVRALPGDIAYKVAAGRYGDDAVSSAAASAVHSELALDEPVYQQYLNWLWDLCQLNLGNSLVSGAPITKELAHQLAYTGQLAVTALLLSVCISIPIGALRAKYAGGGFDNACLVVAAVIRAQPVFSLGLLLIMLFAIKLNCFPVAGFGGAEYLFLPALTLALSLAAVSNQFVRDQLLTVFSSEYYQFAQIKGLAGKTLFFSHGLRNISVPMLSLFGIQLIGLVEGVIMIESLFAWPGIGHALSHAVFARDIPMLQGTALTLALAFVFINTLVDLLCQHLDPRLNKDI